jgi:mono/diheme cytochrome c family protein
MKRNIFRPCHCALLLSVVTFLFAFKLVPGFAQNKKAAMVATQHLKDDRYAEFAKAPKKAGARHNPFEGDASAVAAGKKLFEQHCAECHGSRAEGGKKAPTLRADEVHNATPGTLFWILSNGVVRRGMPVWSKLPEPQRWQIVTFLKSLDPSSGTTSIPVDPR